MNNTVPISIKQQIITQNLLNKYTLFGICTGIGLALVYSYISKKLSQRKQQSSQKYTNSYSLLKHSHKTKSKSNNVQLIDLIGHTPLIYLPKLSQALGCQIYAKVQYLNPFGSSKDRAVKYMLNKILQQSTSTSTTSNNNNSTHSHVHSPIQQIVQASSGSTAISLVQLCKIYNLKTTIFLPNDLSQDKYNLLQILGANIIKVPQVSIVDQKHFYNQAKLYTKNNPKAYFLDQFDNLNNLQIHEKQTGKQILKQMNGKIDAFICSAGTGGTIAGISKYLKKQTQNKIDIILADPQGSGLHAKIKYNTLFTIQQKQGYRLKNPFDTIIEGIGLNRPTKNFQYALIDESYKIKDIQALHMAYYLIENQGLFVGGSCAVNLAAVVKYCRKNKCKNKRIVTILHDSGNRYLKKFYNMEYLKEKNVKFVKRNQYPSGNLDFIQ